MFELDKFSDFEKRKIKAIKNFNKKDPQKLY